MAVIALDLGGTKLAGALVETDGKISHHQEMLLAGRKGKEVGDLFATQIHSLCSHAHTQGVSITGIGVCIPGIYYPEKGEVWAPNIPEWECYPLLSEIRAVAENAFIRIGIHDDRACSILGEAWLGAARGCRNAIFLAVGTGIGAGILVNGQILHGVNGAAGAVGWMALQQPYLPEYSDCGCLEYYASGMGISNRILQSNSSEGPTIPSASIPFQQVVDAYQHGDPVAAMVLDQALHCWAMATANLVSMFNPERILFGGGLFGCGIQFLNRIAQEASLWAQPENMRHVRLVPAELGRRSALYGAAWLALTPHQE